MNRFVRCGVVAALLTWLGAFASPARAQGLLTAEAHLPLEVAVLAADPFDKANENTSRAGPVKVARGGKLFIRVTGTPPAGMHTYPVQLPDSHVQAEVSQFKLQQVKGIIPVGPLVESPPSRVVHKDEKGASVVLLEHDKPFTWTQQVRIATNATPGRVEVPIKVDTSVCNEQNCIPVHTTVQAVFEISAEVVADAVAAEVAPPDKGPAPIVSDVKPAESSAAAKSSGYVGLITETPDEYKQHMLEQLPKQLLAPHEDMQTDLLAFLLAGMFWGGISLITPCVFPMIPITVSFFLKQSEKQHHRPIVMASVYSLTIAVVLTLAAASLLTVFRELSIHPATNCVLGGLFIFFALSLFGMYEIELPNFLARYTSAHEGKGGLVGTMFMALTFTIISFTCVAPFLGGFSGAAASARPMWQNILGGLAFSATFASPFFVLALFPSLLRAMPKSGAWLNSVKVVMGFLEVAAALKFFRTAELRLVDQPQFFTFDLVLGIWIALCLLCALYLIGAYRLPHDTPTENITVPGLMFSITFLALAFYLLPALFKTANGDTQRPGGTIYAWVDSFLLPDSLGSKAAGEEVTGNLPYAIQHARDVRRRTGEPKRIFVDFTGVTCPNCRFNERTVFPNPEVQDLLKQHLIVQLYTDDVPEGFYAPQARTPNRRTLDGAVNSEFEAMVFEQDSLPIYAILEPLEDGKTKVVAVFSKGRIRSADDFIAFLKTP